mmetsp:Transcript_152291/g.283743  ORF Transcript_152291/g.283743 Transcript_152291/m.283743 type:complete len:91 (+) Transcript_152291:404-676(+)
MNDVRSRGPVSLRLRRPFTVGCQDVGGCQDVDMSSLWLPACADGGRDDGLEQRLERPPEPPGPRDDGLFHDGPLEDEGLTSDKRRRRLRS